MVMDALGISICTPHQGNPSPQNRGSQQPWVRGWPQGLVPSILSGLPMVVAADPPLLVTVGMG